MGTQQGVNFFKGLSLLGSSLYGHRNIILRQVQALRAPLGLNIQQQSSSSSSNRFIKRLLEDEELCCWMWSQRECLWKDLTAVSICQQLMCGTTSTAIQHMRMHDHAKLYSQLVRWCSKRNRILTCCSALSSGCAQHGEEDNYSRNKHHWRALPMSIKAVSSCECFRHLPQGIGSLRWVAPYFLENTSTIEHIMSSPFSLNLFLHYLRAAHIGTQAVSERNNSFPGPKYGCAAAPLGTEPRAPPSLRNETADRDSVLVMVGITCSISWEVARKHKTSLRACRRSRSLALSSAAAPARGALSFSGVQPCPGRMSCTCTRNPTCCHNHDYRAFCDTARCHFFSKGYPCWDHLCTDTGT